MLVSVPVDQGLQEDIREGISPQRDFLALTDAINATLITPAQVSPEKRGKLSKLRSIWGSAWAAFRQGDNYDLIISDLDRVGLILALLFKLTGSRKRHILITHGKLTCPWDRRFLKMCRLDTHIDRFVCYGPAVAQELTDTLGIPAHKVVTIRHPADHRFWRPLGGTPERLVASAGLESRDYPTLIQAIRGLDVSLVIAKFSPWMPGQAGGELGTLPENVSITRCSSQELRDLYDRALFVAIPLMDSQAQSGSLVMYEAMAMGKAVVATRTEGQRGLDVLQQGKTGLFVEPGDVDGWREAISYLESHPKEAMKMGQRARALVEEGLNMDGYVGEMMKIVDSVVAEEEEVQATQGRLVEK